MKLEISMVILRCVKNAVKNIPYDHFDGGNFHGCFSSRKSLKALNIFITSFLKHFKESSKLFEKLALCTIYFYMWQYNGITSKFLPLLAGKKIR